MLFLLPRCFVHLSYKSLTKSCEYLYITFYYMYICIMLNLMQCLPGLTNFLQQHIVQPQELIWFHTFFPSCHEQLVLQRLFQSSPRDCALNVEAHKLLLFSAWHDISERHIWSISSLFHLCYSPSASKTQTR